jgi:hypothetical protein
VRRAGADGDGLPLGVLAQGDRRELAAAAAWDYKTLCNWLTGVRRVTDVRRLEAMAARPGRRWVSHGGGGRASGCPRSPGPPARRCPPPAAADAHAP